MSIKELKIVTTGFLVNKLFLLFVAWLAAESLKIPLWDLLQKSIFYADGAHYLFLAEHGYGSELLSDTGIPGIALYVFFPAYPMAARAIHFLGIPWTAVFVLISNSMQFLSGCLLYKLAENEVIAKRTIIFFFASVNSVFFGTAYTESMFVFFTLLTYYCYCQRKKPVLTGLLIGLCILTRSAGVMMYAAVFAGLLMEKDDKGRIMKTMLPATILGSIYPLYCFIKSGDMFSFVKYQAVWNSTTSYPMAAYFKDLARLLHGDMTGAIAAAISIIAITLGIMALWSMVSARENPALIVYTALSMLLFVCLYKDTEQMNATTSVFRYVYGMFPIYMYLARLNNVTLRRGLFLLMLEMNFMVGYTYYHYSKGWFLA